MIQAAAETAYDMVSPGTLAIEPKKIRRFPHHRLAHQPVDLREGVAKAYSVVKEVSTEGRARATLCALLVSSNERWFVLKKPLGRVGNCCRWRTQVPARGREEAAS